MDGNINVLCMSYWFLDNLLVREYRIILMIKENLNKGNDFKC